MIGIEVRVQNNDVLAYSEGDSTTFLMLIEVSFQSI